MEVFTVLIGVLVAVLATALLRFFHSARNLRSQRGKPIPGWERKRLNAKTGDLSHDMELANGSLHDYLWELHEGGSAPVTSFWWRDQLVVSVCSPRAFKDTEKLYTTDQN